MEIQYIFVPVPVRKKIPHDFGYYDYEYIEHDVMSLVLLLHVSRRVVGLTGP